MVDFVECDQEERQRQIFFGVTRDKIQLSYQSHVGVCQKEGEPPSSFCIKGHILIISVGTA